MQMQWVIAFGYTICGRQTKKKTGFRKQLFLWYIKEFGLVVVGVLEGNPTVDKKNMRKIFLYQKVFQT